MPRTVLATLCALVCGLLAVVPTSPATADVVRRLPLLGFVDLVVDERHGRIFVSQGDTFPHVIVTDLEARQVAEVPLAGAGAMALSDDDRWLYVTTVTPGVLTVVDTETLVRREVDLGARPGGRVRCAADVGFTAGRAWVTDRCRGEGFGRGSVVAVDPATDDVVQTELPTTAPLVTNRRLPGVVFIGMTVYDVTGGATPTTRLRPDTEVGPGAPHAGAVTPDGDHFYVLGSPHGVGRYDVRHLGAAGSVPAYDPVAVAVRDDGVVAVQNYSQLEWFAPGEVEPFRVEQRGYSHYSTVEFAGRDLVVVDHPPGGTYGEPRAWLTVQPGPLTPQAPIVSTWSGPESVLDEDRGRLVQVTSRGSLVVADLDGDRLARIPLAAPENLQLDPSTGRVYASLGSSPTVVEIDTQPLLPTVRRLDLDRGACPRDIALAAGYVYVIDACADGPDGPRARLDAIDPATGEVTRDVIDIVDVENDDHAVTLFASERAPDLLLVSGRLSTRVVDVSDGPADPAVVGRARVAPEPGTEIVVEPDGDAARLGALRLRLPDLAPLPAGPCAGVVVIRDDGLTLCRGDGYFGPDYALYRPGATRPHAFVDHRFDPVDDQGSGVVGVHAGARDLYLVSSRFQVLGFDPDAVTTTPVFAATTLTMQAPAVVRRGQLFDVRVDLDTPDDAAEVTVALHLPNTQRLELGAGTIDENGTYVLRTAAPSSGWLRVTYDGGPQIQSASASSDLTVLPPAPPPTPPTPPPAPAPVDPGPVRTTVVGAWRGRDGVHRYAGRPARLALQVTGPGRDRGCVRVRTQARAARGWARPVLSPCVSATGPRARVSVTPARRVGQVVRARAEWRVGSTPATVSAWVALRRVRR